MNKASKIIQAIAECDAFIAKEAPRSADLRPASVAAHLDFCVAHRAKLLGMLEAANSEAR